MERDTLHSVSSYVTTTNTHSPLSASSVDTEIRINELWARRDPVKLSLGKQGGRAFIVQQDAAFGTPLEGRQITWNCVWIERVLGARNPSSGNIKNWVLPVQILIQLSCVHVNYRAPPTHPPTAPSCLLTDGRMLINRVTETLACEFLYPCSLFPVH